MFFYKKPQKSLAEWGEWENESECTLTCRMPGSEGVQQQRRNCTGECDKDQSTVETRFVRCSVETDCQKEETDQSKVKGY